MRNKGKKDCATTILRPTASHPSHSKQNPRLPRADSRPTLPIYAPLPGQRQHPAPSPVSSALPPHRNVRYGRHETNETTRIPLRRHSSYSPTTIRPKRFRTVFPPSSRSTHTLPHRPTVCLPHVPLPAALHPVRRPQRRPRPTRSARRRTPAQREASDTQPSASDIFIYKYMFRATPTGYNRFFRMFSARQGTNFAVFCR